jgi:hypothetical protein
MPSSAGLQVEEILGPERGIGALGTAITAFVGRTLRGPVNRPVAIKNFAQYQSVFGGLWQPSLLSYSVEQFFDNGGTDALVVRVVNSARPASLSLKAGAGVLTLRAVRPGTREFLRASVDYDNIEPDNTVDFNLTIQRVRTQGTEQVDDQEIFLNVSLLATSERYLAGILAQSELVRVVGDLPVSRPDRTLDSASGLATGYVESNSDGDDGAPLTDYDLIGSEIDKTALFALGDADYFNFLIIPPPTRDRDLGWSALLVGARLCKDRGALLMVDPPSAWHTADDALRGMREWIFRDENALMYFPRILAHDKLRGRFESFAPGGAVAGMLSKSDESSEAVLRPGFRPTCIVGEDRRLKLATQGVNTIQVLRSVARPSVLPRTLGAGNSGTSDWKYLAPRRLALHIVNSIERGTRWVILAQPHLEVVETVEEQVREFLKGLHASGAFGERAAEDAYFVNGDQRAIAGEPNPREFHLVIGFAATRLGEFHAYRITHSPAGSKVASVSASRFNVSQFSPEDLKWVERIASQLKP